MQRYLGESHAIKSFVICPSLFGEPCTRRRRYAVAIRLDLLKARIYRQPAQLFTCAVHSNTLRSEKFFVATAEQLANILMRESAKRSSTATSFEDLLSPGTLQRLQEYRLLAVPRQESHFELNQKCILHGRADAAGGVFACCAFGYDGFHEVHTSCGTSRETGLHCCKGGQLCDPCHTVCHGSISQNGPLDTANRRCQGHH